jgi:hypothetical protein
VNKNFCSKTINSDNQEPCPLPQTLRVISMNLIPIVTGGKAETLKEADLEDNIFKAEDLSKVEDPTTSGGAAEADLKEGQILARANLEEGLTFVPTVEEEDKGDGTTTIQEEAKHKHPEIRTLTLLNVSDVAPNATHRNYTAFLHI